MPGRMRENCVPSRMPLCRPSTASAVAFVADVAADRALLLLLLLITDVVAVLLLRALLLLLLLFTDVVAVLLLLLLLCCCLLLVLLLFCFVAASIALLPFSELVLLLLFLLLFFFFCSNVLVSNMTTAPLCEAWSLANDKLFKTATPRLLSSRRQTPPPHKLPLRQQKQ